VVQQLLGNGRTDAVDAALTALVEDADYPIYVALVNTPPGLREDQPEEELASLLHARIGDDGLYVVAADPDSGWVSWESYGADVPQKYDLYGVNPAPNNGEDAPDQSAGGRAAEVVATALNDGRPLPQDQLDEYRTGDLWVQAASGEAALVEPPSDGTYAVVTTSVALAVGLAAFVVLRTAARWRELAPEAPRERRRPPSGAARTTTSPPPATVRADAERELDQLVRALARAHRREAPPLEVQQLVDGSRATAEALLSDLPEAPSPGSDAWLDAVGALVLVRIARRAIDAPGEPAYRPCFFNPTHGRGKHELATTAGDSEVTVPVCRPCQRDAERGEPVDSLLADRRWGAPEPYFEGDSVWARTGYGALADDLWRAVATDRELL
jgi:hypothetical protein